MTDLKRNARMLLGGLLALGSSRAAHADEPPEVWIELPECAQPPYDPAQLTSSLSLELSPYRLRAHLREGAAPGAAQLRVLLDRCDADADSLQLRWEPPGAPPRQRQLSLRDVPFAARARTLALLISETLRPQRWEGGDEQAGAAADSPPARGLHALAPLPDDPLYHSGLLQRSDPYPQPRSAYWSGALRASWVPPVSLLLYGVGTGLAGTMFGPAEWAFEAAYAGGRSTVSGELYELDWLNAALGVDLNLASERQLQIGPRLSVAHVTGYSDSAPELGESLAMLGGRVRISPRLRSERVSLDLLFDASYPLYTLAISDGVRAIPWTAWVLTLGTGLSIEL